MYAYVRFMLLYAKPTQHCKASILQLGFPCGASGKYPPANAGEARDPVGKIPWRRAWQPTLVFLLENPMDRGAGWATVYRVAKSQT